MKTPSGKTMVLGIAVILAANFAVRSGNRSAQSGCCSSVALSLSALAAEAVKPSATNAPAKAALPRLVDLGADKCIPCKMMAPILKDLKDEYEGQMQVDFIDVWKNPEAGKLYRINLIPTQIFYDVAGQELFRHQGFFSKEDILAKWKELGVKLKSKGGAEKKSGAKA